LISPTTTIPLAGIDNQEALTMIRCARILILILALALPSCGTAPSGGTTPLPTAEAPTRWPSVAVTIAQFDTSTVRLSQSAATPYTPTPIRGVTRTPTPVPTRLPSPESPTATATLEAPAVILTANANLRAGPGTAYPVIGGGKAGQTLVVTGRANGNVENQPVTWWRTPQGWVAGLLATANAAAQTVPLVTNVPPPPTAVKVEAKAVTGSTSTLTSTSASSLPDLIVLGPDTQYPVRARVIRGWDYEFVDLSTHYDIVVHRDVFGMLAHQIDDENIRRYWPNKARVGTYGALRIVLVDVQSHPEARCLGWGWAPDQETYAGDPLGMNTDPCRTQHSLAPVADGAGTTLVSGWGSYSAGTTVAVLTAGPLLTDFGTTFLAERLPRPAPLGPAEQPDFSQPLYRPLGQAQRENGRWVWRDPFAQIVPADR
jgi:hypothetical protein